MAERVVELSVIRNERARRRNAEVRRGFAQSAREQLREVSEIDGYVIVNWSKDGTWAMNYCSGLVGLSMLPEFVAETIRRRVAMSDARREIEDYFVWPPEDA